MFSLCFPEIVRPSLSFYLSSQCILIMTKMRAQVKEKKKKKLPGLYQHRISFSLKYFAKITHP